MLDWRDCDSKITPSGGNQDRQNAAETWIGSDTQWMLRVNRWFPRLADYLLARRVRKLYESV